MLKSEGAVHVRACQKTQGRYYVNVPHGNVDA